MVLDQLSGTPSSAQQTGNMRFALENLTDSLVEQLRPLLDVHNAEVREQPHDPDFEMYQRLNRAGAMLMYTMRTDYRALVGYCSVFLSRSFQHRGKKIGQADAYFVLPSHRGHGIRLLRFVIYHLRMQQVDLVYFLSPPPPALDTSPLLEHLGFKNAGAVYAMPLEKYGVGHA